MSYFLLIIYMLVFVWTIFRFRFFESTLYSKTIVVFLFLSKFVMGVGLIWVYQYYYHTRISADVFKYFDDGNIIYSALHENPIDYIKMLTGIGADSVDLMKYYDTCCFWFKQFNYGLINDNRIVIRFNAVFRLFSMGNIYIHTLFMSFFSFIGLWSILKAFENKFKAQKWILLLVVFFFPSVWFWTSGLLKEGILTGAFGILYYVISKQVQQKPKVKYMIAIALCIFILLLSKFYVLVAAIPGFILLFPYKKLSPWLRFIIIHAFFMMLVLFSKHLLGIDFLHVLERKQHDFVQYIESMQNVGSYIPIPDLEPTLWSFIQHAPKAFFTTLFRPTIWESNNLMMLMAAFENLIVVAGLLLSGLFFKRQNLNKPYLLYSVSFVVILFVLSGLTTPVLGALVRYKAPALPFLGILFLSVIDFEKLDYWMKRILCINYFNKKLSTWQKK